VIERTVVRTVFIVARSICMSMGTRTLARLVLLAILLSLLPLASAGAAASGTITAWGYDGFGQVSNTPTDGNYIAVAAGGNHSLALRSDGTLAAWGDDEYGQVSQTPTDGGYKAIAAGRNHNLALRNDGSILIWGSADDGQFSGTPTDGGYSAIAAGDNHSLALRSNGTIVAWGDDADGQVSGTPTDGGYSAIAAGRSYSLALRSNGTIVAWGADFEGQVSNIPTDGGYTAISAGGSHSLALKSDGSIVGWGSDRYGKVSGRPTGTGYIAIAASSSYSLALRNNGTIVVWGDEYADAQRVFQVPTDGGYTAISAGYYNSLALKAPAAPAFPTTAVLDSFNRANGRIGTNWRGSTGTGFYRIITNQVDVINDGPLYWRSSFGVAQEVYVTLTTIDPTGLHELLLKVQGSTPYWGNGAIEILYDHQAQVVRVETFRPNVDWVKYPNLALSLASGDRFGARVLANGTVQIFKNGSLVGEQTLSVDDQAFFNGKGGHVGVWFEHASNATFDDVGGGTYTP
jgi:hypothetical protein